MVVEYELRKHIIKLGIGHGIKVTTNRIKERRNQVELISSSGLDTTNELLIVIDIYIYIRYSVYEGKPIRIFSRFTKQSASLPRDYFKLIQDRKGRSN